MQSLGRGVCSSRALGLGFGSCGCRGRFWWSLWLCLSGTWAPWKFKVSYSATESHCERPTSQDIPTRPKASDHQTLAAEPSMSGCQNRFPNTQTLRALRNLAKPLKKLPYIPPSLHISSSDATTKRITECMDTSVAASA